MQEAIGEFGMASTYRNEAAKSNMRRQRAIADKAPVNKRNKRIAPAPQAPLRERAA